MTCPYIHQRNRAWNVWNYPCLGEFRFLEPSIGNHPLFPDMVNRLKRGQTFLDLGTCFGQDIRKLVSEGAPSENIYGTDLRRPFIDLGYELFNDKDKLRATFVVADIFDPSSDLKRLDGQIDIIYAGAFFHLFGWDEQKRIAIRLVSLLRPAPESMVVGRQTGNLKPGAFPHLDKPGSTMYRHDPETFAKLWEDVGMETGTRWEVEAVLDGVEGIGMNPKSGQWLDVNTRRLQFTVRRK